MSVKVYKISSITGRRSQVREEKPLCDRDCNHCPIINHPNSRLLTVIMNKAFTKFGEEFETIVQTACPNMTCCADCHIDDFVHLRGCKLAKKIPGMGE
jgi:hypothetical protein